MIGKLKIRLSSKRHIPLFYLDGASIIGLDREWYPHQLLGMVKTLLEASNWRITESRLENRKFGLVLLPIYARTLVNEWELWKQAYAPVSVKAKEVLDVGAGCGETAHFYFTRGARKVICVEPDATAVEYLRENALRHSWNVEIIPEPFRLDILSEYRFDFMKMDGEGCEEQLLKLNTLPSPAIVESHSKKMTNALKNRFAGNVVSNLTNEIALIQFLNRGEMR